MTFFPAEIIYFSLFGLYLFGSAFSFRDNGSKKSIAIMSCGIAGIIMIRLFPLGELASVAETVADRSFVSRAITLGAAFIGPVYLLALLFRKQGRAGIFHLLIGAIELVWFLDLMVLLNGLYGKLDR